MNRERTPIDVLEEHLYQWIIDQLHMGARLYTKTFLTEARLIANDLRVEHEESIARGEREVGTPLKLPAMWGNAGATFVSRLLDKKALS